MFQINVTHDQSNVPVAILNLAGQLDGQTYTELIKTAQEIYKEGARNFLLDMGELTYISSAGLVALHTLALLTRGEEIPDPDQGWASLKSIDRSRASGVQKNIKLFNLRPEVVNVLDMVGYTAIFEIFTDKQKALESFS